MTKYYIYHIPTFIHKNGMIGKIGCTELEAEKRVLQQGYTDFEILEEHECIYKASDRERELQKEYGYPIDLCPYYKTVKMASMVRKITGPTNGKKGASKLYIPLLVYKLDGTFVGEYESGVECAKMLNICRSKISNVLNGKRLQTKGYVIKHKPTAI